LEKAEADHEQFLETVTTQKQRLDYILQGTNVGTWEWNVQTGETTFNERWADIIGYTLNELSLVSIDTWTESCHPGLFQISACGSAFRSLNQKQTRSDT